MSAVVAVVAGYSPDGTGLLSLVSSLLDTGVPTLVVDDGSPDAGYLHAVEALGARSIAHRANQGIARSLNDGVAFATEVSADWLLTLDQDTTLPADYIDSLLAAIRPGVGVIGAETIADAGGSLRYPVRHVNGQVLTEEVFQTGSLWSVAALAIIGGFDEDFGIDAVDAAACLRLREAGFAVALAPGVRLDHHYGSGRQVRVLGRTVVATGHSPRRRETMVRNRLRLFPREFRQSPRHALVTVRRLAVNVILGVTIEDNRWAKAKGAARGLLPRPKR
jgi:rhamnosyltransferase